MTNTRVIEVPWALAQLPQSGVVLDIGSCDASYLSAIQGPDRFLQCLDPRDCAGAIPPGALFHHESVIGNTLPASYFNSILAVSTIQHIGLPCYGQPAFAGGDRLALVECRHLLTPGGTLILTVPAGRSTISSWSRQYCPDDLRDLLAGWNATIAYWGFDGLNYVPISEDRVAEYEYRDRSEGQAGAVAGIVATPI